MTDKLKINLPKNLRVAVTGGGSGIGKLLLNHLFITKLKFLFVMFQKKMLTALTILIHQQKPVELLQHMHQ